VLRPEALSVNVRSSATPSSCRIGFWSWVLTPGVADPLPTHRCTRAILQHYYSDSKKKSCPATGLLIAIR